MGKPNQRKCAWYIKDQHCFWNIYIDRTCTCILYPAHRWQWSGLWDDVRRWRNNGRAVNAMVRSHVQRLGGSKFYQSPSIFALYIYFPHSLTDWRRPHHHCHGVQWAGTGHCRWERSGKALISGHHPYHWTGPQWLLGTVQPINTHAARYAELTIACVTHLIRWNKQNMKVIFSFFRWKAYWVRHIP